MSEHMNKLWYTGLFLLVFGIICSSFGGYMVYHQMSKSYYQVQDSNIGGFIFRKGKVYSLEEVKDL